MTNSFAAVDTNILIYLYDAANQSKREASERIVANSPSIPSQVVSEFLNTSRRLLNLPKKEVLSKCVSVINNCKIIAVTQSSLFRSLDLVDRYDFQLFDSIIVATALEYGCNTLYSEDMQHNLLVDGTLRILNPFVE